MPPLLLSSPVEEIKGIGEKRAAALSRGGIRCVRDLLRCFPRRYQSGRIFSLSSERVGFYSGFALTVSSSPAVISMKGRRVLRFLAEDENGRRVHVLYVNQPYLKNKILRGSSAFYFGVLQEKDGKFYLFSPERKESAPDPDRLYPVYPTFGGVSSGQLEKAISQCLIPTLDQWKETLPREAMERFSLMPLPRAIFTLHAPDSEAALNKAKERIAFEELFDFSVKATLFSKRQQKTRVAPFSFLDPSPFLARLPFSLTEAQRRVLDEVCGDLSGPDAIAPMDRLIQGDVGSGKTVIAAAAAYLTAKNGKSTLLMAPTEILAQQHFASLRRFFHECGIPVFLLTGSTSKREREQIFAETTKNRPYVLVGTHALTEESAKCANVSLAITDEQHRFGVNQRNRLGEKGDAVHSLVMSATPIPRSLAMFLYAKSKISVIDQLPPGRQVIDTFYVGEDKMARVYGFLREKVQAGQQAYLVCPLIEDEAEAGLLPSAKEEFEAVQRALPDTSCALLHGKMKNDEKNRVMEAFKNGEIKILVSTTVIEVGVDVPNATVMVIRGAERFGLSQLHQLRGRVGRGKEKSFCILISSHSGKSARERLRKLCDCHDGFELAMFDLKNRGPGEFFGTRQSGFGGLDLSDAVTMELLSRVSECAAQFIERATAEELTPYEKGTRLN